MIELLKLCGFEEPEIGAELPRVEKAFHKLGITAEDIELGKQRLNKYYDMKIKGVRKAFGFYLRSLFDSVLAREEGKTKIIYSYMAPAMEVVASVLASRSKEVYMVDGPRAYHIVIGLIFDKMVPAYDEAEKKWLKAGAVAHCGHIKSFFGPIELGHVPKPDLVITSGFLCETAPKTLDLLHELYGFPIFSYDACFDREVGEYEEATKRSIEMAARSMRKLIEKIQEIVGFEITDDMLSEALDARRGFDEAISKLEAAIATSDPLPISSTHSTLWKPLGSLTMSLDKLPGVAEVLNMVYEEVQARISKGVGVMEKGSPRIMAMFPAGIEDPRLEHLMDELGLATVAYDVDFNVPNVEASSDPYVKMCGFVWGSLNTTPAKRVPMILEVCKRLKVDGVLNRFHAPCRTVAGDALLVQKAVEKELGIPALLLEWENWDPRVYNHEEYKRRLEVFKEILRDRQLRRRL